MSPEKRASKKEQTSGMDTFWKWLYALGMLVAGVTFALGLNSLMIVNGVLVVVAVLVGLFYFNYEEIGDFGLRTLILFFAKEGLGMVPAVGGFITGFFSGWVFFLFPVVLMMALRFFWHKRIATLF